ncbi:MAG TPA: hypothetical protein VFN23_09990 [Ktedonobacteraceae bacterium]|nr:hypothetical protein [Ktedonobacteraceae bacterium]
MADDTSSTPVDPLELWKRWNETTSKAWLNAMQTNVQATKNPYDLYHSWVQKAGENGDKGQDEMKYNPSRMMDPTTAWRVWFDSTMDIWRRASQAGGDPLGMTSQWLRIMEESQAKLLAGSPLTIDPFTLFKEWYDATSEQWSKIVEEAISSKEFLASTRPFMESFSLITNVFRQANVEYFKQLQLPTTLDIASVAELVVHLEEKVEALEDVLETIEESTTTFATLDALADLKTRVEQGATAEQLASLEKHVEHAATSRQLTALEKRLEQGATTEQFISLDKRVSQVENKLDTVLNLLEKLNKKMAEPASVTPARAVKKAADKPEAKGA